VLTLANAAKPVLVDDTAYLAFARHLAKNPFEPYGFELFWADRPQPAMEIVLPIRVGAAVPAGRYAFRVLGAANNGLIVTAQANMIRGPLTNLFNFVRRPLAEVTLTVIDPPSR
jgi:hypothetical protein